jgi:hypothetical protein
MTTIGLATRHHGFSVAELSAPFAYPSHRFLGAGPPAFTPRACADGGCKATLQTCPARQITLRVVFCSPEVDCR